MSSSDNDDTRRRYSDEDIKAKVQDLPRLASLRNINSALSDLLSADYSITSQIAEVIRKDPSLTSRLLKLVNSVFFGLSERVTNIEEAVFFLGWRQIRELAMMTPVLEEMDQLCGETRYERWQSMWQHSIGTAILTREVFTALNIPKDGETDYILGLTHNIGKIVIGVAFPKELDLILEEECTTVEELCDREREIIGWDHGRIGAAYLQKHQLSPEIIEAVRFHHHPERADVYQTEASAVQVADFLVRAAGIPGFDQCERVYEAGLDQLTGWRLLFKDKVEHRRVVLASLSHTVNRLPFIVKGML